MICIHCGAEYSNCEKVCPACGKADESGEVVKAVNNPVLTEEVPEKKFKFLYFLAGFLIPLFGLVLFLIDRKDNPDDARSALIGTISGVAASVVASAIFTAVLFGFYFFFIIILAMAGL